MGEGMGASFSLRFGKLAGAALAALMVATVVPSEAAPPEAAPARIRGTAAAPTCPRGTTDRIDRCPEGLVSVQVAPKIDPAAFRPGVSGVHVWLISSGVQTSVLPELLRGSVQKAKTTDLDVDNIGYGTYAASVILQLLPNAIIHSINVYPDNDRTLRNFRALAGALSTARSAADADVVLLAFPPSDFLDPVTAMANVAGSGAPPQYEPQSAWTTTLNALGDFSTVDPSAATPFDKKFGIEGATVLGVPLDQAQWAAYEGSLSRDVADAAGMPSKAGSLRFLQAARGKWLDWEGIEARIGALAGVGIPVVAPSGDLGDPTDPAKSLQTVFGVAGFSDVVTVGAARGASVAATSSSGPAMGNSDRSDPSGHRGGLRLKPDLVAPAGLVGVLPDQGLLTAGLAALTPSRIDKSLVPSWIGDVGAVPDASKALLDTSLTSAALVAAQMGAMSVQGVRNVARQRAMLRYATKPIVDAAGKSEFVWRQGMGLLQQSPSKVPGVADRPLVLDDGYLSSNFAAETLADVQTRGAVHIAKGKPDGATVTIGQFAGLDIKGQNVTRTAEAAPRLLASVVQCTADAHHASPAPAHTHASDEEWCVALEASPSGDAPAGYYCGFLDLKFKDGDIAAPTCFINGMSLVAHADYVAKTPASVVTYQLIPTLPEINKLPFHPLSMFPVELNSKAIELYERDTNAAGDAVFAFLPPGYYDFRLMGDYGNPIDARLVPPAGASPSPAASVSPSPTGVVPSVSIGAAGNLIAMNSGTLHPASAASVQDDYVALVEGDNPDPDDLGNIMTYFRSFSAYVVPPALCTGGVASGCAQALTAAFGQASQTDADTGTTVAGGRRYAFGRVSQTIGASTATRSIDIVSCTDLTPPKAEAFVDAWEKSCSSDGEELRASFTKGLELLGKVEYTFYTPRPTYRYRLGVNFSYKLDNAALIVEVAGGKAPPGEGLAIAASAVKIPSSLAQAIQKGTKNVVSGRNVFDDGENKANFDFTRFLEGSMCAPCKIVFHFVPLGGLQGSGLQGGQPLLASVGIRDLSIKTETWTRHWWPQTTFAGGTKPGRSLRIAPGFDPSKIGSKCRRVPKKEEGFAAPRTGPLMCEDWALMLHAPKTDASLGDVYYCGSTAVQVDRADPGQCERGTNAKSVFADLRSSKSGFFVDPQRQPGTNGEWPFFTAGHRHAFHGPVSVGTHSKCMTTGRGKFWKQFVIGNQGIHQVAALAGWGPATGTLEFRMHNLAVPDTTPAELEGAVPVARYETLAPPATFVIAGPRLNRLLIILALVAAAIIAGIFNYRRRSRGRGRGGAGGSPSTA